MSMSDRKIKNIDALLMNINQGTVPHLPLAVSFDFFYSAVLSVQQLDAGADLFAHTEILDSDHLTKHFLFYLFFIDLMNKKCNSRKLI